MNKIKLSIRDRVLLSGMLPQEGEWVDMIHIKGLRNQVEITAEEASEIKLKQEVHEGNLIRFDWDEKKEFDKEIEPTSEQVAIVLGLFPKLPRANDAHVILYEKFTECG